MKRGNLLAFTSDPLMKILYFVMFLFIYVITILGNVSVILVIRLSPHLQNPMYYFISNFSFIDFLLSSVIVPKMLQNFLSDKAVISLLGCAAQIYGFASLGTADALLLTVMAYDRYNAMCLPLLYPVIVTQRCCMQLVALSYIISILYAMTLNVAAFLLPLCGSNEIQHYICELPPLLQLSCVHTQLNDILLFTIGGSVVVFCLTSVFVSYFYILSTILRFPSAESRRKAFSTCCSHLLVFSLFIGTGFVMYFQPSSNYAPAYNGVVSVFYTAGIPMLNPLIYSVSNKDVKEALKAIVSPVFSLKEMHGAVQSCSTFTTAHHGSKVSKTANNSDSFF